MTAGVVAFLCSTFSDLQEEREAVLTALRHLQVQHDSMEFFGAHPEAPINVCLAEVRRSNVLIVVVAHRYGTIVPGREVSYPEAEYSEGYELNKPCLVYIRDDSEKVVPAHIERDPVSYQRLLVFKELLNKRHTVAPFKGPSDLAVRVTADVSRLLDSLSRAHAVDTVSAASLERTAARTSSLINQAIAKGVPPDEVLAETVGAVSRLMLRRGQRALQVFLGHSPSDVDIANSIAAGLSERGVDTWRAAIAVGDSDIAIEHLVHGLSSSDCFVFLLSHEFLTSSVSMQQLDLAVARAFAPSARLSIIPVLLEDVDVPPLLRSVRYIDLRDGNATRAVAALVDALTTVQVFLSYAPEFVGHARYLREALSDSYEVLEFQASDLPQSLSGSIERIRRADLFLAIWSSSQGRWSGTDGLAPLQLFQYGVAAASGKPIVVAYPADSANRWRDSLDPSVAQVAFSDLTFRSDSIPIILQLTEARLEGAKGSK